MLMTAKLAIMLFAVGFSFFVYNHRAPDAYLKPHEMPFLSQDGATMTFYSCN